MAFGRGERDSVPEDLKIRNSFWSWRWRCDIIVYERGGKIQWGKIPQANNMKLQLGTLGAADAWGQEQEATAWQLLASLISERQFHQYMMTGMFMEKSRRSGVHYLFRKLRPTVAIEPSLDRMLCCLCLHPIAYYDCSWAGAMCPTDDVIAHLMLMRGDEVMFWRRANQHPPHRPEAGL